MASGLLFFREFVPAGWVAWQWAVGYNAVVVLPDAVVGALFWVILRPRLEARMTWPGGVGSKSSMGRGDDDR